MEKVLIKKKEYVILEEDEHHVMKLERDGKFYYARQFPAKSSIYYDFLYARKKLANAGVNIPKLLIAEKKSGFVVFEWIPGPTIFDDICDHDLDEKILEKAFILNWHARTSKMRLDFNPHNFKYYNGELYYLAYTISSYKKDEDFSSKEFYYWLYTSKFKDYLIEQKLPVDQKRLKNDYERNKELVLLVVKYFK